MVSHIIQWLKHHNLRFTNDNSYSLISTLKFTEIGLSYSNVTDCCYNIA